MGKRKETIEDEWLAFQDLLLNVFTVLRAKFLIAGIIASIEMYGKNTDRKNSKALRPHAHMVIYTYNNFFGFPKHEVEMLFSELGFDYKMDFLKTPKDIAKASCYTIKSAKQTILKNVCYHFYGTKPTHVLINNYLDNNPVTLFSTMLLRNDIDHAIYEPEPQGNYTIPSVNFFKGDTRLQIAEYISKVCKQQNVAFYRNNVLVKLLPAKHSWAVDGEAGDFLRGMIHDQMPACYRANMYKHANWILNHHDKNPVQLIFPKLVLKPNLWEFLDNRVYNFTTGNWLEKPLDPFVSCSKFHPFHWEELPDVDQILAFLSIIVPDDQERHNFIVGLGGLFHPLEQRKQQPCTWVMGKTRTYKSAVILHFLNQCFNQLLIVKLSHNQTQFRYGPLEGVDEGILLIEGFRGENFRDLPTLLNILDGIPTSVKEKYRKPRIIQAIGHTVITSNQSIRDTGYPSHDQKALSTRLTEPQFKEPPLNLVGRTMEMFDGIDSNQWISFGLYANSLYLNQRGMNAFVPASLSIDNLTTKATVAKHIYSHNQVKWHRVREFIKLDPLSQPLQPEHYKWLT